MTASARNREREWDSKRTRAAGAGDALIKYRFRVFAAIRRILQSVAVIDCMHDRILRLQHHHHLHLFAALAVDDGTKPLDVQRQPVCNRQFSNDILLIWHDLWTNVHTATPTLISSFNYIHLVHFLLFTPNLSLTNNLIHLHFLDKMSRRLQVQLNRVVDFDAVLPSKVIQANDFLQKHFWWTNISL